MKAFYITELKIDNEQRRPKSEEKNRYEKLTFEKSKKINNSKRDVLDFLINEQTKFADLEKIEKFYLNQAIKNNNKFNANEEMIRKRKLELLQIQEAIEQNLIVKVKFNEEDLLQEYQQQINDLNRKIILKHNDLECYDNMYERLYKSNVK